MLNEVRRLHVQAKVRQLVADALMKLVYALERQPLEGWEAKVAGEFYEPNPDDILGPSGAAVVCLRHEGRGFVWRTCVEVGRTATDFWTVYYLVFYREVTAIFDDADALVTAGFNLTAEFDRLINGDPELATQDAADKKTLWADSVDVRECWDGLRTRPKADG